MGGHFPLAHILPLRNILVAFRLVDDLIHEDFSGGFSSSSKGPLENRQNSRWSYAKMRRIEVYGILAIKNLYTRVF